MRRSRSLVALSLFKYDVLQMTASFVDLMIVDVDALMFLFALFPDLRWQMAIALLLGAAVATVFWRFDPFRLRRRLAAPMGMLCLGGLTAVALVFPQDPWEGFLRENHVSKFARSGITSVSEFLTRGFMESDAATAEALNAPLVPAACTSVHPSGRRPHIVLIHDELSFDIRQAPGIKVAQNYGGHFKSFDGKARQFIVEGNGGPSWLTEYNVLAGLSSRSFGRFSYFVTRIATGRVERGLPLALKNCGYQTMSLYPAQGAFMGARGFQTTAGIDKFYDAKALGTRSIEPDRFFYDAAARLMSQQTPRQPIFAFVYLAANHFPWTSRFRPDLAPDWRDLGNAPKVDEYLRRQAMSVQDYTNFVARLKKDFPGEPFLIVRFGDHQPEFSTQILEPLLSEQDRLATPDELRPTLLHDLLCHRRHQLPPFDDARGDGHDRRRLSAAGGAGGGRHLARPVIRRAEEDHASLQGNVLRLQWRRRGAPVQSTADRCGADPQPLTHERLATRQWPYWHDFPV